MTEVELKTGMTDAECEHLDEYYTKTVFRPGPNLLKEGVKPGFAHNALLLSDFDSDVAEYVRIQAQTNNKSQAQVINDLIRERISLH
jgi:hypothetical protein